ncbi:Ger(x)C family spore germination protein [Brevibacillus choshinensis]|nr:Ger(x)C family spore germination protein [Brevibacillus choshinensis]
MPVKRMSEKISTSTRLARWGKICLLCLVLNGCSSTRIINEVQLIHSIGLDLEDNHILGTAITHRYEKEQVKVELLETHVPSLYSIFPELNTTTSSQLELGQLRSVVVGKAYASKGIGTLVHTLCRDPNIGFRMQLAVADPQAATIMRVNHRMNVPFILSDTIEQNIKTLNTPRSNLHVFLFNLYGQGRDPYLPYYVVQNDRLKLDGVALFRKDKFVDHIQTDEAFLLKVLVEKSKSGQYPVELQMGKRKGNGILKNLRSVVAFEVRESKPTPSIMIHLNMRGQIKDYPTWLELSDPAVFHATERELSGYLQNRLKVFLANLQKKKVDPVGIGDLIRGKSAHWNYADFQKQYPHMDIGVQVKIKLEQTGVGE